MATQSKSLSFALVCIVDMAGIGESLIWRHSPVAVALITGTHLTPEQEPPDFSLIGQHGKIFGSPNLRGHWVSVDAKRDTPAQPAKYFDAEFIGLMAADNVDALQADFQHLVAARGTLGGRA